MTKKNAFTNAALMALAAAGGLTATISTAQAQTAAAPAPAPTVTTRWSGSPETREEDRRFRVNGRIQYDVYDIQSDGASSTDEDYSGSFARRTFIGVEGRFTEQWRYNVKFDINSGRSASPSATTTCVDDGDPITPPVCTTTLSGTAEDEVRLDDAYLEYAGENFSIFLGQNNAIAHLEDRTSSNSTPFNERSMFDQAFEFGKIMSIAYLTNGGNWSAGVALYGDTLNNSESTNSNESTAVAVRGTWAPIYQRTPEGVTLLHLGVNARERDNGGGPSGGNTLRYRARPNVGTGTRFIDTGSSNTFDRDTFYGAELAGQYNAFGFTAEYASLEATPRGGAEERTFTGGYVDLFWSPTGEGRNYSAADGSFGRVSPLRTLGSDGGIGHVMLSLRYEFLDLTDGTLDGGEQDGYVAGVTWAPIGYVKFQLNYASYNVERPSSTSEGDVDTITLRTQFDW
ncbi:MAG: porin [Hyphomonadaceae bacterium]|nr:porin [Hyphomonadaceae bacterium]